MSRDAPGSIGSLVPAISFKRANHACPASLLFVVLLGCRLPDSLEERPEPRILLEGFEVEVARHLIVSVIAMIDRPLNIRQRFLMLAPEGGHIAEGCHRQSRQRVVFTENPT